MTLRLPISLGVRLVATLLVASSVPALRADPVAVPLHQADTSLTITGPKDFKTEYHADGTARVTYSLPEVKRSAVTLTFAPASPVTASQMTFEMKQAQAERVTVTLVLESGKKLSKRLDSLGAEWSVYAVDLASMASDGKVDLEPVKSAQISCRANPQAGEQAVEFRNWKFE